MTGRVLVTGGAGYIGSHTCKLLAAAGIEPIVYDNLLGGHRDSVRWGPLVLGDIQDTDLLARTLKDFRPDTVIHFAAFAYVGESVDQTAYRARGSPAFDCPRLPGLTTIRLSSRRANCRWVWPARTIFAPELVSSSRSHNGESGGRYS